MTISRMPLFWMLLMATLPVLGSAAGEGEGRASAIDERIRLEWQTHDNPFVITPHRPTYILPATYNNRPNEAPYLSDPALSAENSEFKFQFSFKVPLAKGIWFGEGFFSFAYTQQSFWQAYSGHNSSPFRETNHEPELLFTFPARFDLLGMQGRLVALQLNHQSNGRSGDLSRSWNRVMMEIVLESNGTYVSLKPWWRIPEDDDDNPDIEDYLGHFELRALHKYGEHSLGGMLRSNLQRHESRGALQLDYTFPIKRRLNGYLQIFSGYGESLIDYDHYSNRIGVGMLLTNWL